MFLNWLTFSLFTVYCNHFTLPLPSCFMLLRFAFIFCGAKQPRQKKSGGKKKRCKTDLVKREVKARPRPKLRLCLDRNLVKGTIQSVSNSFLCFLKNKESKKLILCLCIKSRSCTFTTFK